jgi:pimeloyl-ACP methyl ester carboxylesterase
MSDGNGAFEFRAAGLRLVGERRQPDGPSRGIVVFLHGGGQTRHSWDRTAAGVAKRGWQAITLDARGHGDSDWDPDRDYSLDGFAADLAAFVAKLPQAPVLVGASLGGITALTAIGEGRCQARALVLVDVVVEIEQSGVDRINAFMNANPHGFASLEEVAEAISAYNPHRRPPRNLDGLRKNVRLREDGRWYWHWDPAFMGIADEPHRKIDRRRLRDDAAAVTVPTLIVRGLQSDVVSNDGLKDMLRRIPAAEAVDVAAAGHMVAGDDNDIFAARLGEFLTRLAPAPSVDMRESTCDIWKPK